MSVAEDKRGDLWMATYSQGVWRLKGKELISYPIMKGNDRGHNFKIYADREEKIWLATRNFGLYTFDGKAFVRFQYKSQATQLNK